jgi:hypothetical protein
LGCFARKLNKCELVSNSSAEITSALFKSVSAPDGVNNQYKSLVTGHCSQKLVYVFAEVF